MRCPQCGYDLGDGMLPARCPQCGRNLANLNDAPGIEEGARRAADQAARARDLGGKRPTREKVHRRTPILLAIGIALLIAFAAYVSWRLELWGGTTLPDVTGWNVTRATEKLTSLGYEVETVEEKDDGTEGLVLSMDPEPGSRSQPEGSTITLHVSVARRMPDVMGKTQAEAEELLKAEGLTYRVDLYPDDGEEGIVMAMSCEAGTVCTSTREVAIGVTRARVVPDVTGKTRSEAEKLLEEEGYTVKVKKVAKTSDDQQEGTVIACDPAAGTKLSKDSEVTISVVSDRADEIEENARAILNVVYNCSSPSDETIGGGLRAYLADSWSGTSDHDIWYGLVKRGGGEHADAGEQIQALPRTLDSVNSIEVSDYGVATCSITVTWDWSPMGAEYANVTSQDTRTVTLTFDDDAKLTGFDDPQTDVPYYEIS